MDLFLRGRGVRISEQFRAKASQKLSKLERLDARASRVDIEISSERSPRLNGIKRIEGTISLPRYTIRASATAADVDAALDLLVDDVVTTGATITAAATVLRAAGAVEVRAVAAARTPPPRP